MLNASGNIENKKDVRQFGLRDYATDAIRFWEPRRIGYNVVLAVIVILWLYKQAACLQTGGISEFCTVHF
jgi:hypothetical protein